jgi:hypothetical protein
MRIISAGLIRSGSTWQYNALRVIMQHAGLNPKTFWIDDYKGEKGNVLIKAHEYKGGLTEGSKVFTCIRPEEEVKASMRRRAAFLSKNPDPRFMGTANVDRYPRYYRWFRLWRGHAVYNMQYKDLKERPELVIHEHIKALGLTGKVDPLEVLEELNNIKPPSNGGEWNNETFYHAGHITKK